MERDALKLVWSGVSTERCVECGRHWPMPGESDAVGVPVPAVYTVASIEADDVPEPVCDSCVESKHPDLFAEMLAERQRFMAE